MTIYTGPVFEMAKTQFGLIADHLEIPQDERARLLYPKRAITVSIPVHMDDGRTEVFQGYRVQHHLTLGPTKGRHAVSSSLDVGEVAALAIWMSWKCATRGSALWRGQGRCRLRPTQPVPARVGGGVPPLHAGDDPLRQPADRRHGAGYGDERAGNGLVHGHLFHA